MRVAVVEDDLSQAQLISLWLEHAGYSCQLYADGRSFQAGLGHESFDLVVLDWILPDVSGDELLQWLRGHVDWAIPVIFTTVRDAEEDIVRVLSLGADDYLVKPLRQQEFLARVLAVTRRSQAPHDPRTLLEVGPYTFDPVMHTVRRDGRPIDLTHKEFDLALFLFRHPGRLISRRHILESVWAQVSDLPTRTVDTHISRVRSKLDLGPQAGWQIVSVYSHGYLLEPVGMEGSGSRV